VISNTQGRDQYLIVLDNDTEYRIDVVSRTGGKLTSETIHDKVQELYQNEENQNKNGGK
jgi:hypothetical protein